MECENSAGFGVRLGAAIIDGVILVFGIGCISLILYGQFLPGERFSSYLIQLLYYILLPVLWSGYTLGKRAVGIRIARVDGEKVGIGTMLMRDFVSGLVYALTFGIGLIVSAFMVGLREDNRAIHDFMAGTYVTNDPPEK